MAIGPGDSMSRLHANGEFSQRPSMTESVLGTWLGLGIGVGFRVRIRVRVRVGVRVRVRVRVGLACDAGNWPSTKKSSAACSVPWEG